MTQAAAAPGADAGPARILATRELLYWTAAFFAAISLCHAMTPGSNGLAVVAGSFSAVKIIAWGCALRLIQEDAAGAPPASLRQFVIVAGLATVSLFAPGRMGQIVLIPFGLYLLRGDGWSERQRRAGIVFAAIGGQHLLGILVPLLLGPIILRLDTAAAGLVMQLFVPGTVWHGNILRPPGDVGVTVLMACSSFANLSYVALCFASLHSLDGGGDSRRAVAVVGGIGLLVILLNTARLITVARSLQSYAYWHDGAGGQISGVVMTMATIALCSIGSRWASGWR